jgi:nucleoside-diphosphate-sugar epimerase
MNILITGSMGNIGTSTLTALQGRGHCITCFDQPTLTNRRLAKRLPSTVRMCWGDIRQAGDLAAAVVNQDVVVHLAAIIPEVSHTGDRSEENPSLAYDVNVTGTQNLIAAVKAMPVASSIVFTSTLHVYGLTQHLAPPRKVHDPLNPADHYARHKVACEAMLRDSGLRWTILRLGVAVPMKLILSPAMFLIPPSNRIEYVHTLDAGVAIANAVETEAVWGRVWNIGGGPRCQLHYEDMLGAFMQLIGQAPLPQAAYNSVDFCVDWLDTQESQLLLSYQTHTYDDYLKAMTACLRPWLALIRFFRPVVRWVILRQSPYLRGR